MPFQEVTNPPTQIRLMDDDSRIVFESSLFAINIKKEVCSVLESFLYFLRGYENKKPYNMLCFMLDPIFKSFHLKISFFGCEKRVNFIEGYDGQPLYPMLLKCDHYLHPMTQSGIEHGHQIGDAKFHLNIF
jgi:hypothetical protein